MAVSSIILNCSFKWNCPTDLCTVYKWQPKGTFNFPKFPFHLVPLQDLVLLTKNRRPPILDPRFIGEGPIDSVLFVRPSVRSFVCNTVFLGSVHYFGPPTLSKRGTINSVRPSVCDALFSESLRYFFLKLGK